MFDFKEIAQYAYSIVVIWIAYIHKELKDRPSRSEIDLRQEVNTTIQNEIKDDIKEIKEILKDLQRAKKLIR